MIHTNMWLNYVSVVFLVSSTFCSVHPVY